MWFLIAGVYIDTIAVVSTCICILYTIYTDWEWHISDILAMFTGINHLLICPGTKYHSTNLAIVDHCFTAFPVSCCIVFLNQAVCNCIIKDLI